MGLVIGVDVGSQSVKAALRVVGGGAQSRLWLQIKADGTRLAVRAIQAKSAASSVAAMLAAEPVLPDAANAAVYSEAYAGYRWLFDGVEGAL